MKHFTFGKYKGMFVNDVIRIDPEYVRWAEKNISFFKLSRDQQKRINSKDNCNGRQMTIKF